MSKNENSKKLIQSEKSSQLFNIIKKYTIDSVSSFRTKKGVMASNPKKQN